MPEIFLEPAHPDCTACDLGIDGQQVIHRSHLGIPTRPWQPPNGAPQALLVIGEAPGSQEDRQGQCFVGPSGQILNDWLTSLNLTQTCDVFLSNPVRCRLTDRDAPTGAQVKACRAYLLRDLLALRSSYKKITLLLCGASASSAFKRGSVREACRIQGSPAKVGGHEYPCFVTYHPANIMPGRSPANLHAVADHLALLSAHLTGDLSPIIPVAPDLAPNPPVNFPSFLALDIETYGILKSLPEQTTFHPAQSVAFDGVSPRDLIISASLAYLAPDSRKLKSVVFLIGRTDHRKRFLSWLQEAHRRRVTLVAMNTLFDVGYLRTLAPFRRFLAPPIVLEDVAVWNALSSDVRPERSLEALARLFGQGSKTGFRRFDSVEDPEFHQYNAHDAVLAFHLRNLLKKQATEAGRSEFTRRHYSDLLWTAISMLEFGVAFDRDKLKALNRKLGQERARCILEFLRLRNAPLGGPGSKSALTKLFTDAVEAADLIGDRRLIWTPTERTISTKEDNMNLLLGVLPMGSPFRPAIECLRKHRAAQKLSSTYTKPLLSLRDSRHLIDGIAYPRWYVAPMEYRSGSRGSSGGTVQSRITCTDPPLQTDPPQIQECYTSRFRPGVLVEFDLSQIEYRMAAWLSQDDAMAAAFWKGVDFHVKRAIQIFGPDAMVGPDGKLHRQVGKTANFLMLFRGGAWKLQETLRRDIGLEVSLDWCESVVQEARREHVKLLAWQDALLALVNTQGYLSTPILGQRRWFTKSPLVNKEDYEATICNLPVQASAANLMLSAQSSLTTLIVAEGLQSCIGINKYDSILVDCPVSEVARVEELWRFALTRCAFRSKLEAEFGAFVPIEYTIEKRLFV